MNRLFDSGVVDKPPKKVLAKVLIDARKLIGKGEDDWDTRDTCKAIELLPEKYREQFAGADAIQFKNMMQRLRKDKVVPKVKTPPELIERFQKMMRDFQKNRERRGTDHLSPQYKKYVVEQSPEWVQKAREHKERCGYRCQLCGSKSRLEVHHTPEGYRNLCDEKPWHLLALCAEPCHPIADMFREGWFSEEEAGFGFFSDEEF